MIATTFRLLPLIAAATLLAGAETRVRIEGIQGHSERQVLDLMGGRLYQIRHNPASPSRADDAAFLLRQILEQDGYADVEVTPRIVSSDEILLTVGRNTRISLGEVSVVGTDDKEAGRLAKLFASPAEKDLPTGSTPPFREPDVATGLSYLQQDLQAQGFWTAEAAVAKRELRPEAGAIDFVIRVTPGPLHHIGKASATSKDPAGVGLITTAAAPYAGLVASTGNLNAMRAAVEKSFHQSGYPDVKITMASTITNQAFTPEFSAEPGVRTRLRHVSADGFTRTNPKRVESRLSALEGRWYDKAAMNQRMRELLATGAFTSARIEPVPVGDNLIDAKLHFEEARAREITLAFGADSYDGPIGRFTYADRNLFGQLLGFGFGFEVSSRGVLGETRITDPWIFGSDYAGTARIYALVYGHEGYSSFDSGIEGILSRKFTDHYRAELSLGWSMINNSEDGLPRSALGETIYSHPRLRLTQVLDYRDNAVLPTSGWHMQIPLQVGSALGDEAAAYFKAGLTGGWYHRLGSDYQLAVGGQFGMLIPTGDSTDFPIDLRYFNGGSRSVRSFPERELGPTAGSNNYATGGEAYWATNLEVIRPITGPAKLVAFLDAGALSQKFADIGSAEIELAAGLGIRLDLPIGPVRFEYGFNLTQDPGEPAGAFHFAIGTTF